jgi:AraC-like DNA-binding protein
MNLYFNARSAVLLTVLLQAVITSSLLFYRNKKNNRVSDIFLAFLILFLGLSLTDFIIGFLGIYDKYPQVTFFPFENLFLVIVLIYLFSISVLQIEKPKNIAKHLILPVAYFVFHFVVFLLPTEDKQNWLSKYYFPFIAYIETLLFYLLSVYYFLTIFQKLNQHGRLSSDLFSGIETSKINWLNYFLIGFVTYLSIDFSLSVVSELFNFNFEQQYYKYIIRALLTSFLCIAGYNFKENISIPNIEFERETFAGKEKLLTDSDLEKEKQKIVVYFSIHKPYINSELTLSELADGLKMNSNTLSFIINNAFHQNFNDFVNKYRVDELIEKLKNPANVNFTILSMAFDSGFNSKTTFNRVFKKVTSKNPREFLADLQATNKLS